MTSELLFEGVSTARLIDQVARARGWDPATYAPAQGELDRMCQLLNQALSRAWHFAMWPQLMLTRSVTYRPSWTESAAPYPLGEQVFWKGRYWEATASDGTSEEPGPDAASWRPCEREMVCGISYVRYGIEEADLSQGVYSLDPDRRADAIALPAVRSAFGCIVQRERGRPFVPMPFIRYRPMPPRLSAAPWDEEAAYPKGTLCMGSDGESYEAWTDVDAGVDPATTDDPEVWAPRRCPRLFEDYAVLAASAALQTDDNARGAGMRAADAELSRLRDNFCLQVKQPGRAYARVFR